MASAAPKWPPHPPPTSYKLFVSCCDALPTASPQDVPVADERRALTDASEERRAVPLGGEVRFVVAGVAREETRALPASFDVARLSPATGISQRLQRVTPRASMSFRRIHQASSSCTRYPQVSHTRMQSRSSISWLGAQSIR